MKSLLDMTRTYGERTNVVSSSNGTVMATGATSIIVWESDHIKPDSKGGEDTVSNGRPLQWYNNHTRSSGRLTCSISVKE